MEAGSYVLMLEDDEDDRYITRIFFEEKGFNVRIEFLEKASDVMPYLRSRIAKNEPLPRIIMLDKNAPSGNGIEVLGEIKASPELQIIPVVMLSGTAYPPDVAESYRLGASSYIVKPFGTEQTSKKIASFLSYWFETVELPPHQL